MTVLHLSLLLAFGFHVCTQAFVTTVAPRKPFSRQASSFHLSAAIAPGDTVLVIGGTSGVGQLVTQKLAQQGVYQVRATSRDAVKGQEILGDQVQVVSLDLVGGSDEELQAAVQGASAVVISVGTTAFPTAKWKGGNTPEAIDKIAVTKIANALSSAKPKKVVLVTSVGIERTGEMPFVILNLFGVLDSKKAGEQAIQSAAVAGKFDYVIVRPGRLIGGPFTNLDVARLLQIEGGAENGVTIQAGDSLLGDCKRDACAEAIVQCLVNDECRNVAFSIVSNDEKALTSEQWKQVFRTVCG